MVQYVKIAYLIVNMSVFRVKDKVKVISFLISVVISSVALAEPLVSEEYEYYYVNPNTRADILTSLKENSPIREHGKTMYGISNSDVKWNFKWKYNSQICWITSVNTKVTTTYILPKLIEGGSGIDSFWDNWYPNLLTHEKGHHKLAVDVAEEIEEKIRKMPSYLTCDLLEKNANNIGLKSISKLRRLQKDYDKQTNHGETQGASGAGIFRYLNDS